LDGNADPIPNLATKTMLKYKLKTINKVSFSTLGNDSRLVVD